MSDADRGQYRGAGPGCGQTGHQDSLSVLEGWQESQIQAKCMHRIKLQSKLRAMINTFVLGNEDFHMNMFCLYEGKIVEDTISYNKLV